MSEDTSAPAFDLQAVPLVGREEEFEAVVSFVSGRLLGHHGRALFVFGSCGCGKTSTVLRAVRSFHTRPLPCDRQVRVRGVKRPRAGAGALTPSTSSSASSSARPSAGGAGGESPLSAGHRSSRSSGASSAAGAVAAAEEEGEDGSGNGAVMAAVQQRYPQLYAAVAARQSGRRVVRPPAQGHYVNCADLSPVQLAEAICDSFRQAYPQPTAGVAALMENIRRLSQQRRKRSGKGDDDDVGGGGVSAAATAASRRAVVPLQVVVLDEVEYVRPAARPMLSALAALSFQPHSRVALVCISNQRDLVHVPEMLLEELAFASYSTEQLKSIAAAVIEKQIERHTAASSSSAPVSISPSLYDYIARKALTDYAGDVRQVSAMGRRVVHTAFEGFKESASATASRLEAAVASYTPATTAKRATAKDPQPQTAAVKRALTLSGSVKAIRGHATEDGVQQHISTMPEQTLYLLSCLLTLTQKNERDRRGAGMGQQRAGGGQAAVAASTSMTHRDAHGLYMRLMARNHFPPMNGSGVAAALSYLADLGIITRPQARGNEQVFSFSGAWSVEAMETAMLQRGEELRKELVACGLGAEDSANRFAAVLQELKKLTGMTM